MKRPLVILAVVAAATGQGTPDRLIDPMNRFAASYNHFAAQLQRGKLDLREAKKLSKLWREIEQSGEWPEIAKSK